MPKTSSLLLLVVLLVGCGTRPPDRSTISERDGPGPRPPPGLAELADAEPRLEPIRAGGANKPYTVAGRSYLPMTQDLGYRERGIASWYGRKFDGKPTASGEIYDMYAMTAAHPTLPIPSYARIRNPANGRQVVVRINDRGPFDSGRIVDLSYSAALRLDLLRAVGTVDVERITFEDIRTGAWRQDVLGPTSVVAATAAPAPRDELPAPTLPDSAASMGSAPVLPVVAGAPDAPMPGADTAVPVADASASHGFWIQLGAFRQLGGATSFQQQVQVQVAWLRPLLTVIGDAALYKLQAGPFARREDALDAAGRLRAALQLVPLIVERR